MQTLPVLTDFLNLNIGQATDAYLRKLALLAVQSRHLTPTVEQFSAEQRSLGLNDRTQLSSPASGEAEVSKGKLVEGRYLVTSNSTVTDQKTRLVWMQFPLEGVFTFRKAQQAVKNLNSEEGFAGYTDWRLPTHEELLGLVVKGNCPSICKEAFPDTPAGWFWVSISHTETYFNPWTVGFGDGGVYRTDQLWSNYVRLVRDPIVDDAYFYPENF